MWIFWVAPDDRLTNIFYGSVFDKVSLEGRNKAVLTRIWEASPPRRIVYFMDQLVDTFYIFESLNFRHLVRKNRTPISIVLDYVLRRVR